MTNTKAKICKIFQMLACMFWHIMSSRSERPRSDCTDGYFPPEYDVLGFALVWLRSITYNCNVHGSIPDPVGPFVACHSPFLFLCFVSRYTDSQIKAKCQKNLLKKQTKKKEYDVLGWLSPSVINSSNAEVCFTDKHWT